MERGVVFCLGKMCKKLKLNLVIMSKKFYIALSWLLIAAKMQQKNMLQIKQNAHFGDKPRTSSGSVSEIGNSSRITRSELGMKEFFQLIGVKRLKRSTY